MINIRQTVLWVSAALLTLVVWAYHPGLSGDFLLDDDANIVSNEELTRASFSGSELWRATLSGISGPLGRPVSMFTFAVEIALNGVDPFPMKVLNLIIHLATGFSIYLLAVAILRHLNPDTDQRRSVRCAAVAVAAIWLLHPINVTAVTYIVQRMTSLSALFSVLAVYTYLRWRVWQLLQPGRWHIWPPLTVLFTALAILSKESGVLVPVYLLVTEVFLLRFSASSRTDSRLVCVLHAAWVSAAVLGAGYLLYTRPDFILGGYESRPFNLAERLLTEARVLVWYLRMIVLPDISQMTLYHDAYLISRSLLSPPATLLSIATLLALIVSAWLFRVRYPLFGFGVFWFLGGHLIESTVVALELVFEHRNYLPGFGILLAVVAGLRAFLTRLSGRRKHFVATLAGLAILALAVATHIRTFVWSDRLSAVLVDAENHPESPRANMAVGTAYARLSKATEDTGEKAEFRDLARISFQKAADLRPDSPNALLAVALMYYAQGARPPSGVESELKRRLSSGQVDAGSVSGLKAMTDCLVKEVCRIDEAYYLAVMENAFLNPNITDVYGSYVLRLMAGFHTARTGDNDLAIMLVKRAMELDPGKFEIRLELIENLVMGGYLAQAARELKTFERTDKLKKYGTLSANWRSQIESLLAQSTHPQ